MPFQILGMWCRWVLSVAVLVGGVYLLREWYAESQVDLPVGAAEQVDRPVTTPAQVDTHRVFRFAPGWDQETAYLVAGTALLAWAVLGRLLSTGLSMLTLRSGTKGQSQAQIPRLDTQGLSESDEDPRSERVVEAHVIKRPDGSELRVETYGPADAPPLIWTHGWTIDSTEWFYQKRNLADRFRLIVWDEPGLGLSKKPANNDYRLDNFAANLKAVIDFAGGQQPVLVGHSIGGMTLLTFCKIYPEILKRQVAGLVLVHTTYTNPVRTTKMGGLYRLLEKPVLVPLLYLTIALWPVVWVMQWLSVLNGSARRSTAKSSFAGTETQGQLNFFSKFSGKARPDVVARGMLGMLGYDATSALAGIDVPTMVIIGDKDTTTLPEAGEFIAAKVPRARLESLSPARHLGLIEHHSRFDRLVTDFARSCQTAKGAYT